MIEWVDLSQEVVVIATEKGASAHRPPRFGSDPFLQPMTGEGHPETTHWLLEGAIAVAGHSFGAARRRRRASGSGVGTPAGWAYRLAGYFHTTHATRRLLPVVARSFLESGQQALADWARRKISEEEGHDELALRDLAELGYRSRELVQAVIPPRAAAWVADFERIAACADPVESVGYAHALERLALLRGEPEIAAIEASLPAGVNATRCLRVHSAVGTDRAHIRTNVTVTARLAASLRRRIARACHRTARIYFDPALDSTWDASAVEAGLSGFGNNP